MENILNIANDYIIVFNKYFKVEFCNKKLLSKIKYTLEELKNLNNKLINRY